MTTTKIRKKPLPVTTPSRAARLVIYVTPEMKKSISIIAAQEGDTTSQYMFSVIRSILREHANG